MEEQQVKKTFKQKLVHELSEYLINVIFLTLFFGAYFIARRLTLAHYDISVDDYFSGFIKALIIGKVIMIGSFLTISRKYENKPLIIPVLYKVLIFLVWCVLFDVVEGFVKGWIHSGSLSGAYSELVHHHFSKVWLGGLVMLAVSFIPFFMLKELSRIMGYEKFRDLFFRERQAGL
jgi:cell division protein FtsW (lipid II flippase)